MAKLQPYRRRGGKWKNTAIFTLLILILVFFSVYTYNTNDDFRSAVLDIAAAFRGEKPSSPNGGGSGSEGDVSTPNLDGDVDLDGLPNSKNRSVSGPVLRFGDVTLDEAVAADAYGVIVDLKLTGGEVSYISSVAGAEKAILSDAFDLKALSDLCHEKNLMLWGRLSAFTDNAAPRNILNSGVTVSSGVLFLDANYLLNLDPYKKPAADYITALAKEAVSLGVDMILLADVCFPAYGRLSLIDYPAAPTKQQQLGDFIFSLSTLPITVEIPMRALYDEVWRETAGYGFDCPASAVKIDTSALPQTINGAFCLTADDVAAAISPAIPIGAGAVAQIYID